MKSERLKEILAKPPASGLCAISDLRELREYCERLLKAPKAEHKTDCIKR